MKFKWEAATDSVTSVPLYRLGAGDLRDFARTLSCQQNIAADGAFSLGMLARFEPLLQERSAAAYRELFWEAGLIGQALYLAAEAAGVRGTGIGCYFDDVLHRALGLCPKATSFHCPAFVVEVAQFQKTFAQHVVNKNIENLCFSNWHGRCLSMAVCINHIFKLSQSRSLW